MRFIKNEKTYKILQFFFVILLLATAIGKLIDSRGFADVIQTYKLGLSSEIAFAVALSVSFFELGLAISLLAAFKQRINAVLLILMHMGYVVLASSSLYRGLDLKNCGCFGVFLQRSLTINTVYEDLFLVLLSVIFYLSVDHQKKPVA